MKKIFAIIFLALSLISFTACVTSDAKVTGIRVAIINFESDGDSYANDCIDGSTMTANDYIVKIGVRYQIVVELTFTGGSRVPGYDSAESVKLIFDSDLLQIGEPRINHGKVYYPLECKKEFTCVAILIEDGEYHTEVIVSAQAE